MRCGRKLAKTQFGTVLEFFDVMRLQFGSDTIWNCLRIFSMRCDWILAKTQVGIVLGYFQSDAIGIGLRHILELS